MVTGQSSCAGGSGCGGRGRCPDWSAQSRTARRRAARWPAASVRWSLKAGSGFCGRRAGGESGDAEGFFVGDGRGVALFVVAQAVFDGAGAGAVHGGDVDVVATLLAVLDHVEFGGHEVRDRPDGNAVDDAGVSELGGVTLDESSEVSHDGYGYAVEGDFGDVFPVVVLVGGPGGG